MTSEQLSKLIILSCKKAMREEMQKLKHEILTELRQVKPSTTPARVDKLTEVQRGFRQNYQVQQKRNTRLSNNPMLNEILRDTDPIPTEGTTYLEQFEREEDIINLPTNEVGQPIMLQNNKAMANVVEAMNRDYSHLVERMDKGSNQKQKQQFREHIVSKMSEDSYTDEQFEEDLENEMANWG